MGTDQFETFQSFNDMELANQLGSILKQNGIEFKIWNARPIVDKTFVDTSIDRNIHIQIARTEFDKAKKAVGDYYRKQLDNIDDDYYLLQFSDKELMEIISKPDEWGAFDYQLAQKLLRDRGHAIEDIS